MDDEELKNIDQSGIPMLDTIMACVNRQMNENQWKLPQITVMEQDPKFLQNQNSIIRSEMGKRGTLWFSINTPSNVILKVGDDMKLIREFRNRAQRNMFYRKEQGQVILPFRESGYNKTYVAVRE